MHINTSSLNLKTCLQKYLRLEIYYKGAMYVLRKRVSNLDRNQEKLEQALEEDA